MSIKEKFQNNSLTFILGLCVTVAYGTYQAIDISIIDRNVKRISELEYDLNKSINENTRLSTELKFLEEYKDKYYELSNSFNLISQEKNIIIDKSEESINSIKNRYEETLKSIKFEKNKLSNDLNETIVNYKTCKEETTELKEKVRNIYQLKPTWVEDRSSVHAFDGRLLIKIYTIDFHRGSTRFILKMNGYNEIEKELAPTGRFQFSHWGKLYNFDFLQYKLLEKKRKLFPEHLISIVEQ